ncbi:rRNA methyltransferase, partial [Streptomyces sp. KAI-27]|nr:rRNA methyltransferase [Streptomyces sp. KAI-27]
MPSVQRVTSRNARFQQWEALLGNRKKRNQLREFLVQGVRPISLAVEYGWRVRALLYDDSRKLSGWARELLGAAEGERVALAPELMAELGEKSGGAPEVVAVVEVP